jgi:hypothetical protein
VLGVLRTHGGTVGMRDLQGDVRRVWVGEVARCEAEVECQLSPLLFKDAYSTYNVPAVRMELPLLLVSSRRS